MNQIKTYKLLKDGSGFVTTDIQELLEYLRIELEENLQDGEYDTFDFGVETMTQEQYDNLGDFDGF